MPEKIDRPCAIITGASDGIGAEFALQLAGRGTHSLILVARNLEKLEKVKRAADLKLLESSANKEFSAATTEVVQLDLSEQNAAQTLFEKTKDRPVTLLVANAGTAVTGIFEEQAKDQISPMINLNIVNTTELVTLFMPKLKAGANKYNDFNSKHALVGLITLSSIAGLMPVPAMSAYAATKAYILFLTEGIHHEQRVLDSGVNVTCVLPGPVRSSLWETGEAKNVLAPWMAAEDVVKASLSGFDSNTAVVVPGVSNKFTAFSIRFAPRFLVRRIASLVMNQWPQPAKEEKLNNFKITGFEYPNLAGYLALTFIVSYYTFFLLPTHSLSAIGQNLPRIRNSIPPTLNKFFIAFGPVAHLLEILVFVLPLQNKYGMSASDRFKWILSVGLIGGPPTRQFQRMVKSQVRQKRASLK